MDWEDELEEVIYDDTTPLDTLHRLLFDEHEHHQPLVRVLQLRASPASVAPLTRALSQGFERYAYTCSEDGTVAKWFSHAFADIGTPEAIAAIRAFARSDNPELAEEMAYRLGKLRLPL